jgi:hypothetical protein
MSVWRKLTCDLLEDMHRVSEYNNRNMSAVKMVYQLKVRCDLCLWSAEYKLRVESCLLVLRTAFSMEGSDVLKKKWHRYTCTQTQTPHTHTHTHTHTHRDTQVPLRALTQHKHTFPTITNHLTTEVLNRTSQLCDGIQCRLSARTGGNAKGEILDWELGNKQIDQIKTKISSPQHPNCLWCPNPVI